MLANPRFCLNGRKRYFYCEANFAVFPSKLLELSGYMLQNFVNWFVGAHPLKLTIFGAYLGGNFLRGQNLAQPTQALFLLRSQYCSFSLEIARTYWN